MNAKTMTTLGEMDLIELDKTESFEELPCGKGKITKFYFKGECVKIDYQVIVSPEAYAEGLAAGAKL